MPDPIDSAKTAAAERIKMSESKTNKMSDVKTTAPADFTNLFLKGVEQAAELQKKSLEAALVQNAEAIAIYKKGAQAASSIPSVDGWKQ
jgi:hypothetical protein